MDYLGIISIFITIVLFVWVLIDRERKEGAHQQEVAQLRVDVDRANERCSVLDANSHDSASQIAVLATKIDYLTGSIMEIKTMLENMRTKNSGGR